MWRIPGHSGAFRRTWLAAACALAGLLAFPAVAGAVDLPSNFGDRAAFSGLTLPTAVEFAPDGRVFVAEKSGLVKVFSGPGDDSAEVVTDLRTNVYNAGDRGLLDIALDPEFGADPHLYVLYTHDAAIGGTAPRWGSPDATFDSCPNPPGANSDGCVVSGRLSRLPLDGDAAGAEQVLVEDWCQQYSSHSVGAIAFDAEGALLASGGDGASHKFTDWGQLGSPPNPCGDPPSGVGGIQTPPDAEGGALRSQDLRTPSDPTGLDGSVIRVDRTDGSPLADNPNAGMDDLNARRIVADGLRNPFRIAVRPGTSELWIGDVGWTGWEEINRTELSDHGNLGWPCAEGAGPQQGYDAADLSICEDLYAEPGSTGDPFYTYPHSGRVVSGEPCPPGSSSISGLAFYTADLFPAEYSDALFFADYSRGCIWAMRTGSDGVPDPGRIETFAAGAANPVSLELGDDGALYYPDVRGGEIRAIRYFPDNQPPAAVLTADPRSGYAPLTVSFDGSASVDPDAGDTLSYAWDLDGDGEFDDSSAATPSHTFSSSGVHLVKLRVTDPQNATDTAQLAIHVDNRPPVASIDSPTALEWAVGDQISFSGSADDPEQGPLGPQAFDWELTLRHCPSNCHEHPFQGFDGVAAGGFAAPDHDYPSHLELELTATDEEGLSDTASVVLDPRTVEVTMASSPPGAKLSLGPESGPAPFDQSVIVGSSNSIGAEASFESGGLPYEWDSWGHGGQRHQNVTAPETDVTYSALYRTPPLAGGPIGGGPLDPAPFPWVTPDAPGPSPGEPIDPGGRTDPCPGRTSPSVTCTRDRTGGLVIRGTASNEVLIGTRAGDRIMARGGDDRLVGEKGQDELYGGSGEDTLKARDDRRDSDADCGGGRDRAVVDGSKDDRIRSCERVRRD